MKTFAALLAVVVVSGISWSELWLTKEQQAQRLMDNGDYAAAAESFRDPMRQGAAWYRAGEFEKAAQAFARGDSPEAHFNQGNAWLMRGKYETAVASYDRALLERPDWREAVENRDLAIARGKRVERKGGDMGNQTLGADEVVFNNNNKGSKSEGQDTEVAGGAALSDQQIQALWLRRVQTRPADFLKAKFSYQLARDREGAQ